MPDAPWFDRIPIWAQYFGWVATALLSIAAGFGLGLRLRRRTNGALPGPLATMVAALLGLLAFILGITYDMAASRFYARRQILIDEVNAIETTYLRAGFIAEPHRTECRNLLKRYVDVRASYTADVAAITKAAVESEKIQGQLWNQALNLARGRSNPRMDALFIQSLNNLIDLHTLRVTTILQYQIPERVWAILLVLIVLTMTLVGYQFGISGVRRFMYLAYCILAVGFSLGIILIADLDNATAGRLKVSQQPMIELRLRLNAESTEESRSARNQRENSPHLPQQQQQR